MTSVLAPVPATDIAVGSASARAAQNRAAEASFLTQLQAGDQQAFSDLVRKYHAQLQIVARAIIGPSLAEEVVQEAWVSVYKAIHKFEGRSSLKTWLYTIVSNGAKTRLRKESRQVRFRDDEEQQSYLSGERFASDGHWSSPPANWDMDTPEQLLQEEQLQACIEKTLLLLPPQQKAAFTLRDIEQQSLGDICNILDTSNSNIRVLLHRARLKLMQVVDRYRETGEC
jgi:RNA polymerase sigma-70 factor (ECF subfamily)|tara:strand:+ start:664 stop:1344 length:681 start_codon:yes stop_codon:yes gene_type:complete